MKKDYYLIFKSCYNNNDFYYLGNICYANINTKMLYAGKKSSAVGQEIIKIDDMAIISNIKKNIEQVRKLDSDLPKEGRDKEVGILKLSDVNAPTNTIKCMIVALINGILVVKPISYFVEKNATGYKKESEGKNIMTNLFGNMGFGKVSNKNTRRIIRYNF